MFHSLLWAWRELGRYNMLSIFDLGLLGCLNPSTVIMIFQRIKLSYVIFVWTCALIVWNIKSATCLTSCLLLLVIYRLGVDLLDVYSLVQAFWFQLFDKGRVEEMSESHVYESSRSNQFDDVYFFFESFSSFCNCLLFSFLRAAAEFARKILANANLFDAFHLWGHKRLCLKLEKLGDQVIVKIVGVKDAEN